MGSKFRIQYINDKGHFKTIDIAAGSIDEALQLFRRKYYYDFITMVFLIDKKES
jgi:hypothetical protein